MENTRAKTTRNSLILLLTATIWGMAFVSQSKGMDYMHPFTFNGVRSLIGATGILVYILISRKIAGDKAAKLDWKLNVKAGLLCGIFLTIASTLQQFGIKYTSVGKAGFITTLYIIFVPMFGIFLKKKVAPVVWAAAGMAAVGLYLLCMTESLRLGAGDIMVFLCAIAYKKDHPKISILLAVLSWTFHHSMFVCLAAYFVISFYSRPKWYFLFRVVCLLLSLAHVSYFQNIFVNILYLNSFKIYFSGLGMK